jgi:apolipoprotein N-acyltransferase
VKVKLCANLKLGQPMFGSGKRGKMDTLAFANLLLDVASIVNFVALLWMLRAVIKNRNYLRGFSVVGSFLTFVSLVGFELAYHLIGNVLGFILTWATVAFWFVAFVYTLRQTLRDRKIKSESVKD